MSATESQTWRLVSDYIVFVLEENGAPWTPPRMEAICRKYFTVDFGNAILHLTENQRLLYRTLLIRLYDYCSVSDIWCEFLLLCYAKTLFNEDLSDFDFENLLCLFAFAGECALVFAAMDRKDGVQWTISGFSTFIVRKLLGEIRKRGGYRLFGSYLQEKVKRHRYRMKQMFFLKHQQKHIQEIIALEQHMMNLYLCPHTTAKPAIIRGGDDQTPLILQGLDETQEILQAFSAHTLLIIKTAHFQKLAIIKRAAAQAHAVRQGAAAQAQAARQGAAAQAQATRQGAAAQAQATRQGAAAQAQAARQGAAAQAQAARQGKVVQAHAAREGAAAQEIKIQTPIYVMTEQQAADLNEYKEWVVQMNADLASEANKLSGLAWRYAVTYMSILQQRTPRISYFIGEKLDKDKARKKELAVKGQQEQQSCASAIRDQPSEGAVRQQKAVGDDVAEPLNLTKPKLEPLHSEGLGSRASEVLQLELELQSEKQPSTEQSCFDEVERCNHPAFRDDPPDTESGEEYLPGDSEPDDFSDYEETTDVPAEKSEGSSVKQQKAKKTEKKRRNKHRRKKSKRS